MLFKRAQLGTLCEKMEGGTVWCILGKNLLKKVKLSSNELNCLPGEIMKSLPLNVLK